MPPTKYAPVCYYGIYNSNKDSHSGSLSLFSIIMALERMV